MSASTGKDRLLCLASSEAAQSRLRSRWAQPGAVEALSAQFLIGYGASAAVPFVERASTWAAELGQMTRALKRHLESGLSMGREDATILRSALAAVSAARDDRLTTLARKMVRAAFKSANVKLWRRTAATQVLFVCGLVGLKDPTALDLAAFAVALKIEEPAALDADQRENTWAKQLKPARLAATTMRRGLSLVADIPWIAEQEPEAFAEFFGGPPPTGGQEAVRDWLLARHASKGGLSE